MNIEEIEQLLRKYEEGQTSLEEEAVLRDYFRSGQVPEHLKAYEALFFYHEEMQDMKAKGQTDILAKMTFEETESKRRTKTTDASLSDSALPWTLRIAAGFILLLVGFSAGLMVKNGNDVSGSEVAAFRQEVERVKRALMYSSKEQASASERISAINMSVQMPDEGTGLKREISEILIHTMNNDDNVNVRQAAAEALFRFREEPSIRKALVYSLSRQTNPLMQITLIDMLVAMREKEAISEMQRLLMNAGIRDVVKVRLEAGIAELKAYKRS